MQINARRLEITTDSPETIAAVNCFIDQSLRYGKDAETVILAALDADPNCAIAHAYAASYYLSQEHTIARQQAVPHLVAAKRNITKATRREQWYIVAIAAWANGNIQQAIALHEAIAEQFPQDLISVQQGQYHYFYRGDRLGLLKIAEKVLPANRGNHYLGGMLAFGLEQCHELTAAEAIAQQAVAINRQDPWAHHAIAHVMETQRRIDEGIAWMEQHADTWAQCNSMLYTHNWWHVALYYLAKGDVARVLVLYDTCVWGGANPTSPKDQVGAISLLLRLELLGIGVGDRWQLLSFHLQPRIHEHALPFQDLHFIYALTRAGRNHWVNEMLRSMQAHARMIAPSSCQTWENVAIPAAKGMIAHANSDWATAVAELKPVLSLLEAIGGSHAQRKLFAQIYSHALFSMERQGKAVGGRW
jgi:tetratricopeptide (TPR) repeat protein